MADRSEEILVILKRLADDSITRDLSKLEEQTLSVRVDNLLIGKDIGLNKLVELDERLNKLMSSVSDVDSSLHQYMKLAYEYLQKEFGNLKVITEEGIKKAVEKVKLELKDPESKESLEVLKSIDKSLTEQVIVLQDIEEASIEPVDTSFTDEDAQSAASKKLKKKEGSGILSMMMGMFSNLMPSMGKMVLGAGLAAALASELLPKLIDELLDNPKSPFNKIKVGVAEDLATKTEVARARAVESESVLSGVTLKERFNIRSGFNVEQLQLDQDDLIWLSNFSKGKGKGQGAELTRKISEPDYFPGYTPDFSDPEAGKQYIAHFMSTLQRQLAAVDRRRHNETPGKDILTPEEHLQVWRSIHPGSRTEPLDYYSGSDEGVMNIEEVVETLDEFNKQKRERLQKGNEEYEKPVFKAVSGQLEDDPDFINKYATDPEFASQYDFNVNQRRLSPPLTEEQLQQIDSIRKQQKQTPDTTVINQNVTNVTVIKQLEGSGE